MAKVLTVGGTARSWRRGSLMVTRSLNGTDTLRAILDDAAAAYWPTYRSAVTLAVDGTTIFGGRLVAPGAQHIVHTTGRQHVIEATDYSAIPAEIQVTDVEIAAGGTLRDAVDALVAMGLDDEGLTRDDDWTDEGPTLGALSYGAASVAEIFDDLTRQTGWPWTVTPAGEVLFIDPSDPPAASFTIDSSTPLCRRLSWSLRADYANTVVVRAGSGQVLIEDEAHTADGVVRVFALDYPAATAPGYVTIDGTDYQPVGINGVDDMEWTYRASDNSLVQRVTDGPEADGVVLTLTYTAQYPFTVTEQDAGELAAYGQVAVRLDLPDCFDRTTAEAIAVAELARRMARSKTVTVVTDTDGLEPGQALTITWAGLDLSGDHLVTQVDLQDEASGRFVYRAVCEASGQYQGSWVDLWRRFLGGGAVASSAIVVGGGGTTGTSTVAGLVVDLGGSASRGRRHTTGTWAEIQDQRRVRLRDTWFSGGQATVRVRYRNASGGSVVFRLYDYTDAAAVGASASLSDTTDTETSFVVVLGSGLREYGLEVQSGDGAFEWWAHATLGSE